VGLAAEAETSFSALLVIQFWQVCKRRKEPQNSGVTMKAGRPMAER
jgi:hypothetical protein